MGRRRVYPPAASHHQTGGRSDLKCYGLGFHEERYAVVVGPEPWPWPVSTFIGTQAQGVSDDSNGGGGGGFMKRSRDFFTSRFCRWLSCYSAAVVLILVVLLLWFTGSRPPRTNLEAIRVESFGLRRDPGMELALWFVNGDLRVVFSARNPSGVAGFQHRWVATRVSVFYGDVLLGQAEEPEAGAFSQRPRAARNVTARVAIREQCVRAATADALRAQLARDSTVRLRVAVDARVQVRRFWWARARWFNMTCFVTLNTASDSEGMDDVQGKVCL